MLVTSKSFEDGERIPQRNAFGTYNEETHVELTGNESPHLAWRDAPDGTASFAIVCCDPDVPSSGDDVNQEGKTVPFDLPRVDFYHWVIVDLPPGTTEVSAGEFSTGVTARGKEGPGAARGARQGINDYTSWFDGDADMAGEYFGYDGPCPPWNDERAHHYVFTVYALDVARVEVENTFRAPEALAALEGHVLASVSITGTYSIYPDARLAP